jgi:dihydroorotase
MTLAEKEGVIRVLPVGCITRGRKGKEIVDMGELSQAGVVALSDDGSSVADASVMYQAMCYSLAFNLILIEHCEEPTLAADGQINEGIVATRLGLKGIPTEAEDIIVARDILLAQATSSRIHIAHVSTATSVNIIRQAKQKGIKVTAEATPHHLIMTEESLLGYNTLAKVKPPLRREEDRQALIQGVADGTIDVIATDHSPHTDAEKMVEFDKAPFGISGFETALPLLLGLVRDGYISLYQLIDMLTEKPARIIGKPNLGMLKTGSPAEVTLFDPEKEWLVSRTSLISKGKNTPLIGQMLKGKVMATIFGDEFAYLDESIRVEHV